MSGTIDNTPNNVPPTNNDLNVLNTIFGRNNCTNDTVTKVIWWGGFAVIATALYLILTSATVGTYIKGAVGNASAIWVSALIFFILILGLDWLATQWRLSHPLC